MRFLMRFILESACVFLLLYRSSPSSSSCAFTSTLYPGLHYSIGTEKIRTSVRGLLRHYCCSRVLLNQIFWACRGRRAHRVTSICNLNLKFHLPEWVFAPVPGYPRGNGTCIEICPLWCLAEIWFFLWCDAATVPTTHDHLQPRHAFHVRTNFILKPL